MRNTQEGDFVSTRQGFIGRVEYVSDRNIFLSVAGDIVVVDVMDITSNTQAMRRAVKAAELLGDIYN